MRGRYSILGAAVLGGAAFLLLELRFEHRDRRKSARRQAALSDGFRSPEAGPLKES